MIGGGTPPKHEVPRISGSIATTDIPSSPPIFPRWENTPTVTVDVTSGLIVYVAVRPRGGGNISLAPAGQESISKPVRLREESDSI